MTIRADIPKTHAQAAVCRLPGAGPSLANATATSRAPLLIPRGVAETLTSEGGFAMAGGKRSRRGSGSDSSSSSSRPERKQPRAVAPPPTPAPPPPAAAGTSRRPSRFQPAPGTPARPSRFQPAPARPSRFQPAPGSAAAPPPAPAPPPAAPPPAAPPPPPRTPSPSSSGSSGLTGNPAQPGERLKDAGHTMKRHVGQTEEQLAQRAREKSSSNGTGKASGWSTPRSAKDDIRKAHASGAVTTLPGGGNTQFLSPPGGTNGTSVYAQQGKSRRPTGTSGTAVVHGPDGRTTTAYPTAGRSDRNRPPPPPSRR
jgi:hypothetical protein